MDDIVVNESKHLAIIKIKNSLVSKDINVRYSEDASLEFADEVQRAGYKMPDGIRIRKTRPEFKALRIANAMYVLIECFFSFIIYYLDQLIYILCSYVYKHNV